MSKLLLFLVIILGSAFPAGASQLYSRFQSDSASFHRIKISPEPFLFRLDFSYHEAPELDAFGLRRDFGSGLRLIYGPIGGLPWIFRPAVPSFSSLLSDIGRIHAVRDLSFASARTAPELYTAAVFSIRHILINSGISMSMKEFRNTSAHISLCHPDGLSAVLTADSGLLTLPSLLSAPFILPGEIPAAGTGHNLHGILRYSRSSLFLSAGLFSSALPMTGKRYGSWAYLHYSLDSYSLAASLGYDQGAFNRHTGTFRSGSFPFRIQLKNNAKDHMVLLRLAAEFNDRSWEIKAQHRFPVFTESLYVQAAIELDSLAETAVEGQLRFKPKLQQGEVDLVVFGSLQFGDSRSSHGLHVALCYGSFRLEYELRAESSIPGLEQQLRLQFQTVSVLLYADIFWNSLKRGLRHEIGLRAGGD